MNIDKALAIAKKGLSFDIIRASKLFPPFDVLNTFLQCGIDDAASEVTLEWAPFELSKTEYETFFTHCQTEFGELEIDVTELETFEDWFSEIAVRLNGE